MLCECKTLVEINPEGNVWDKILLQFLDLVAVAKACNAGIVVFACKVTEYPQQFQERIQAEVGDSMGFLLLNKQDLEIGYRNLSKDDPLRRLSLHDIVPKRFPEAITLPIVSRDKFNLAGGLSLAEGQTNYFWPSKKAPYKG